MEYTKGECSCRVVHIGYTDKREEAEVEYCPKHAACDDMYEALKDMVAQGRGTLLSCGHTFTCSCPSKKAAKALAKAEGK